MHSDPDLSVTLSENNDADRLLDSWEEWADFLTLPKLGQPDHGGRRVVAKRTCPRRRGRLLAQRRSRARLRRKLGKSTARVHRNEPVIACYE